VNGTQQRAVELITQAEGKFTMTFQRSVKGAV